MTAIYHSGELDVQARAGVQAEVVIREISTSIQPAAQHFFRNQQNRDRIIWVKYQHQLQQ